MCIDKDNFQHEQQRNDNHTRAELAQPAGTDLHHAVRDKAQGDTFGDREAKRHHHCGDERRHRLGQVAPLHAREAGGHQHANVYQRARGGIARNHPRQRREEDHQQALDELLSAPQDKPRLITLEVEPRPDMILSVQFIRPREAIHDVLAVAVFHDISEMARLMRVRKEFVANVSHELRTPLTAIAGYAETLRDSAAEDPSICAKFAETILRNAQHMGTMVEDLLKLSRIESGAVPMEMETVKAASILSDVTTACQPQTAAHNLTLETDIDPALTVRADPHFIGQVFRNLIENACRYAPEGSTIKVSGGKRLDHNGLPEALFMICDDGPGIPQADIARVFERFYRVEKHRSSPASTGLGLAICKHIVERHGGRIWAEPGPGGCLQFTLPLAAETEKRT